MIGLRQLADNHQLLLVFDEVQTGCGRTGHWFGHQYFGIQPDIMTLAKSLCGGLAGGAMLARREIAPSLRPGTHASTFGGNPIAAAAGIAMIETIEQDGLLESAAATADIFSEQLEQLRERCDHVRAVRQAGLMIGIELSFSGDEIVNRCMQQGLLINCTQGNVLRMLPAMNIEKDQARQGMQVLSEVVLEVAQDAANQV
jgi:acetylornithine/succinyldiaminopimelate/putrescine aminotransferase